MSNPEAGREAAIIRSWLQTRIVSDVKSIVRCEPGNDQTVIGGYRRLEKQIDGVVRSDERVHGQRDRTGVRRWRGDPLIAKDQRHGWRSIDGKVNHARSISGLRYRDRYDSGRCDQAAIHCGLELSGAYEGCWKTSPAPLH